jgi:hypothetical protein
VEVELDNRARRGDGCGGCRRGGARCGYGQGRDAAEATHGRMARARRRRVAGTRRGQRMAGARRRQRLAGARRQFTHQEIHREADGEDKEEIELGGAHRKTWPVQPMSTRGIDPPSDREDFPLIKE